MSATTTRFEAGDLSTSTVDAVVIGGGAAGLNGALMLARSRRSVVVIDSGTPAMPRPTTSLPKSAPPPRPGPWPAPT